MSDNDIQVGDRFKLLVSLRAGEVFTITTVDERAGRHGRGRWPSGIEGPWDRGALLGNHFGGSHFERLPREPAPIEVGDQFRCKVAHPGAVWVIDEIADTVEGEEQNGTGHYIGDDDFGEDCYWEAEMMLDTSNWERIPRGQEVPVEIEPVEVPEGPEKDAMVTEFMKLENSNYAYERHHEAIKAQLSAPLPPLWGRHPGVGGWSRR